MLDSSRNGAIIPCIRNLALRKGTHMAEIKIPEPKYATTRVHIDTITIPDDNEVVVIESSSRYRGRLFVYGSAVYDPNLPVHVDSDVWGR